MKDKPKMPKYADTKGLKYHSTGAKTLRDLLEHSRTCPGLVLEGMATKGDDNCLSYDGDWFQKWEEERCEECIYNHFRADNEPEWEDR
jgi:hypothetical protein